MVDSLLANVVIAPLSQQFTYSVPEDLSTNIAFGDRVTVSFGNRVVEGFVISLGQPSAAISSKIKPIRSKVSPSPCFDEQQLELFKWVANFYSEPLASVIELAVPKIAAPLIEQWAVLNDLQPDFELRGSLQLRIVAALGEAGGRLKLQRLRRQFRGLHAAMRTLEARGVLRIENAQVGFTTNSAAPHLDRESLELMSSQQVALSAITQALEQRNFAPFLLHGVTGSGKTEVYIRAIEQVCARGGSALVLVPEIALTPQLIDRFTAVFPSGISVLHSALSKRDRWEAWRALLEGRSNIAIGARSAVFAPLKNLQLIIVDEEHDGSYKQQDGIRYHGRDLAIKRAQMLACPVVLGTATPSLESYLNAAKKRFHYLPLPQRAALHQQLECEVIDLSKIAPDQMRSQNITPQLYDAISNSLTRGEQSFVLYNRRGFASYLQCENCQRVLECPNCSVTLTYHRSRHSLVCHYCGLRLVPPEYCSGCSRPNKLGHPGKLVQRGGGTERLAEELSLLFPEASLLRLDRDAADSIEEYRAILARMRSGEGQILVGTQMIAKGHDLPRVTVVGVADCDVGLHFPDFRAAERVFQLLTQVAGRAGRGELAGKVVLQTRSPQHVSIVKTVAADFKGFAQHELANRNALGYPPYIRLLRIVASSPFNPLAHSALTQIRNHCEELRAAGHNFTILGPAPAPLERLKARWRWHLLIKHQNAGELSRLIGILKKGFKADRKIRVAYDLDPQDML